MLFGSLRRGVGWMCALVVVAALVVAGAAPASAATSDLLIPPPNLPGGFTFNINQNAFSVFALTPGCDATITSATNVISALAAAAGYQVSIYGDSGGQPGTLVGSLTGTSVASSRTISFTGSVNLSSGVRYWVGTRSTVSVANSLPRADGTQASPWSWDAGAGNQAYTNNGGSTWTSYTAVAFPQLTLTGECNSSPSSGARTAQTVHVSLNPGVSAACTSASSVGVANSWVYLPAASDCIAPPVRAGATLLGWATAPDFPIAIARRQVDNGWGAYEIYSTTGQLSSVFIPAGRATFLSADGNLFAIWDK